MELAEQRIPVEDPGAARARLSGRAGARARPHGPGQRQAPTGIVCSAAPRAIGTTYETFCLPRSPSSVSRASSAARASSSARRLASIIDRVAS